LDGRVRGAAAIGTGRPVALTDNVPRSAVPQPRGSTRAAIRADPNDPAVPTPTRPRRLLMVAFHFPPLAGSSGIQRTLRLVQHLPALGWQPIVLTASPLAYEATSEDLLAEVPAGTLVERAFALDSARHISLRGRHLAALSRPDRWMTWRFDAVRRGLRLIRQHRPDAIWSTYPIATAHTIGAKLQAASGLPWVADFRDPMAQEGYPADPITWRRFSAIEQDAARQAAICTFTTPGTLASYRARYPAAAPRMQLLENGYDEGSFVRAEAAARGRGPLEPGRIVLLHSGIVYPSERDPTGLFRALASIKAAGTPLLRVRFRAAVHDALLHELAARHGVADLIEVAPPLPYLEALEEMMRADGLLVLQAANSNEQVPAKLYEYLRAGRPILCLSDAAGDTWRVLEAAGLRHMASLVEPASIEALFGRFARDGADGLMASEAAVAGASREGRAARLARLLAACVDAAAPRAGEAA
jgi:glycosyltransferase involved in cell wall biosynthesis